MKTSFDFDTKFADGTGRLQRGWYANNNSSDSMPEEDRFIGPWRTEAGALAAIKKAERADDPEDALLLLAIEAGKTPAMSRARESHERIRLYLEG